MTDTDTRFANIEMDLDDVPAAPAVEVAGVTIRENARARAAAETSKARAELGLKLDDSELYFASGTKMLADGEKKAREYRQEWEKRPLVGEAMDSLHATISAERRRDFSVKASELRLDEQGRLTRGKGGAIIPTAHAFSQLCNRSPFDNTLRYNVNAWIAGCNKTLKLRTRNPNTEQQTREAFAIVSPKYAAFDSDQVARAVKELVPADTRATVEYDGSRTQIDVSYSNPYELGDEIAVGRLHRVGLRIDKADDGTRAFRIRLYAERIACINCTILADSRLTFNRRHVGSLKAFRELVRDALASTGNAIRGFGDLWREANERAIHDSFGGTALSAQQCFKRLIAAKYLHVPHVKAPDLLGKLMDAWSVEPGDTAAAVNRAITRLAHTESSWKSRWYQDDLETVAGELLYQKVYALDPLTEKQKKLFA